MAPPLQPIDPKNERWEPAADPNEIVVPGLDTNASVNDQIEQIEQLITIKLQVRPTTLNDWTVLIGIFTFTYNQNIDANFSRIQQVMDNRILPAVKRYAVGTEPVRDAAKVRSPFYSFRFSVMHAWFSSGQPSSSKRLRYASQPTKSIVYDMMGSPRRKEKACRRPLRAIKHTRKLLTNQRPFIPTEHPPKSLSLLVKLQCLQHQRDRSLYTARMNQHRRGPLPLNLL